jgi:hypothetical protein
VSLVSATALLLGRSEINLVAMRSLEALVSQSGEPALILRAEQGLLLFAKLAPAAASGPGPRYWIGDRPSS